MLWRRTGRLSSRLLAGLTLALFIALLAVLIKLIVDARLLYSAAPLTPPRTIPNTDVNPYGANFFLAREVEPWKLDKTLQMAADAGIGWVKQQFAWEEVEPRRKGEFIDPATKGDSWAKFDQIVEACEKYGLRIVARLDRPPDWSREDNTYKQRPPDNLEDYGDYVYAFVKRYEGRIDYIQIWNEPNIFPEWGNRPVDPPGYVELLKVAYRRAKEANPNVYVLCAPLASTLGERHPDPGKWTAMNDLQFLEEMYQAGAAQYFDIYATNGFGMDRPPEDPPDANVLNFQRVLLHRRIMERYGDGGKAVWFNEYGWNAAPETMPQERLIWQRVSEKDQAEFTLRGIELARNEWPWAGVFMIWYFRQVGNIPTQQADYYFRMVDSDFTPRLLYLAVQDVAGKSRAPGPGLYQETNPAVKAVGNWRNVIDYGASGKAFIRSDTPGDSLTFIFRGTHVDLLTRRWPGAGRLLVTLNGRSVPGLPQTRDGISYVDLYSPTSIAYARVPLVRDATPDQHTLRITVDAERHPDATGSECVVDALEVTIQQGARPAWIWIGITLVALGLDGALLWRAWRRLRWVLRP